VDTHDVFRMHRILLFTEHSLHSAIKFSKSGSWNNPNGIPVYMSDERVRVEITISGNTISTDTI